MKPGDSNRHKRHCIRLRSYDYSGKGAYFVTICTKDRSCILGEVTTGLMMLNGAGLIVETTWKDLVARFADMEPEVMVIMPNHVHFIVHLKNQPRVSEIAAHVGAIHESPLQY